MAFHIHVPKPLHGWKAFTNEIAVIVLGVLIALALEAGVEALHWRHKVEGGQERLKDELLLNGAYMAEQVVIAPCVAAQLDKLQSRLTASEGQNNPAPIIRSGPFVTTLRMPTRYWPSQTWEALQQDGTSNHFPGDVQAQLGQIYQKVILLREMNVKSEDRQGSLQLLGYPMELSSDLKAGLLRDIFGQSQRTQSSALNSAQALAQFRNIEFAPSNDEIEERRASLTPGKANGVTTFQYCKQNNLPLADWRAEVAKVKI